MLALCDYRTVLIVFSLLGTAFLLAIAAAEEPAAVERRVLVVHLVEHFPAVDCDVFGPADGGQAVFQTA